jgi:histidinol phosphatase-like PHP family hydrolase
VTSPPALLPDLHAHTTLSDGQLSVGDLQRVVDARGVRPSVADHISRDVRGAVASVDSIRAYLDELDRHRVLRGGEFCWHDALWREVPADLWPRFTHCLGSLHAIFLPDGTVFHAFASKWPDSLDRDVYMDAHVDNLERFAREMPVDVLSHPTLLPWKLRSTPLEELWTEAREERAVEALFRAGIAFEISNRYRPHARFVKRAIDRGVRVSLGSDGHSAEQVGDIAWPHSLARDLGVPDDAIYDPLVYGSKTQR